jgi:hypothetical protein
MDDVVAVQVRLNDGTSRYLMTWGRIQDPVDPGGLEEVIRGSLDGFALGGDPVSVALCPSLQDAAGAEYFFEALVAIARQPIPFGDGYAEWVREKDQRMRQGKDIWFLGGSRPT